MAGKILLGLFGLKSLFFKRKKHYDILDKIWKGEMQDQNSMDLVADYHNELKLQTREEFVDSSTWSDLNMDNVFNKMNRCSSSVGKQYLYHLLHQYHINQNTFNNSHLTYKYFTDNIQIRRDIQHILFQSNQNSAFYISKLLFSELSPKPKGSIFIYLASIFLFVAIVATFFFSHAFYAILGFSLINIVIHYKLAPRIFGFLPDMQSLRILLKVANELSAYNAPVLQINNLKKYRPIVEKINKKSAWLLVDITKLDELSASVIEYFNTFFLLNIIAYLNSIDTIRAAKKELLDIFEQVASLDATISIASFLNFLPFYCVPEYNNNRTISFGNVYHPLLQNPVANSFELKNASCLITGSNMAGKTTFIKTVGINIILSQSINVCLAESANIPKVFIKSSISRQDDLNQNKSYYFREIEAILEFLNDSQNSDNYCFLIDEIFRGTNTLERLSASTAVLEFLGDKSITLVTTHDIELQELLNGKFKVFHFREQIDNNVHYFDYKIKPGPCSSRNAIRLLGIKGYPKSVIDNAQKYCDLLLKDKIV